MEAVFADTDVCIDLLSGRKPFSDFAEALFSLADRGTLTVFVSALSFANIDYVLRSRYSASHSRDILAKFKTLVQVLPVDNKILDLALASDFSDFEDAIQYACALEHKLTVLLTRNLKDFKKASLTVVTPEIYLRTR